MTDSPIEPHTSPCHELVRMSVIVEMLSNDLQHKFIDIKGMLDECERQLITIDKKIDTNYDKINTNYQEIIRLQTEQKTEEKIKERFSSDLKWKIGFIVALIFSIISTIIAIFL